jgi:hypothetical protein
MSYESYVCCLLEQTRIDVIWKTGPGSGREVTVTLVARIRFFFLSEFELLVDLAWRQTRKNTLVGLWEDFKHQRFCIGLLKGL